VDQLKKEPFKMLPISGQGSAEQMWVELKLELEEMVSGNTESAAIIRSVVTVEIAHSKSWT
jgi:hypothetical protein